jgi:2-keto-4-pentenoate hydratase
MRRQGELAHSFNARGASVVGYKTGLGTAAALAKVGTSVPIAGLSPMRPRSPPRPGLDLRLYAPELRARARFTPRSRPRPCRSATDAAAAIDVLTPAIELVDLAAPNDLAAVLAGDIFHRAFAAGPFIAASPEAIPGSRLEVTVDGAM